MGRTIQVFAPDYADAIVELGTLVENSSAYIYQGYREMTEVDLQNLQDSED
jgi:hypothetical protein